ncbi:MarR family winged helix-turn-helix transcriptional regulator [Methylomonas methanica]|uniref:Transcriptional regulator, MarR family n=1 Tax=Methylomonas methanica (strain DSM 25384 / MC09) TaxID=857087 RepID=G0A3X0_METMM|nr:MarR family winged helix-turn-helix transcriptional regulator [Methylomonas methanica]AEG02742.1 transcriptional regulator, MarR family [Methylomonas methanica MC09]
MEIPDLNSCTDCTGFNLRKANRAVSQFYDDMLRPAGIRGTQYSLLVAVKLSGPVVVTKLAEYVVMDRTTLTRNLEILGKQGLVKVSSGDDRRTRMISITAQGLAVLAKAYPLWEQAQAKIKAEVGIKRLSALMEGLSALVKVTQR